LQAIPCFFCKSIASFIPDFITAGLSREKKGVENIIFQITPSTLIQVVVLHIPLFKDVVFYQLKQKILHENRGSMQQKNIRIQIETQLKKQINSG